MILTYKIKKIGPAKSQANPKLIVIKNYNTKFKDSQGEVISWLDG